MHLKIYSWRTPWSQALFWGHTVILWSSAQSFHWVFISKQYNQFHWCLWNFRACSTVSKVWKKAWTVSVILMPQIPVAVCCLTPQGVTNPPSCSSVSAIFPQGCEIQIYRVENRARGRRRRWKCRRSQTLLLLCLSHRAWSRLWAGLAKSKIQCSSSSHCLVQHPVQVLCMFFIKALILLVWLKHSLCFQSNISCRTAPRLTWRKWRSTN